MPDDSPPTRTHAALDVCSKFLSNAAVDMVALAALAYVTTSGASEATLQIVVGAIASVAIGKRYIGGK